MAKYISSHDEGVFEELIKITAAKEEKEKKDYLESLYDVDTGRDKTGKELLLERAHKESGKIIDSYREPGGIVENEQTQQDEDIKAAIRQPDAASVSRKSTDGFSASKKAEAALINELMIIAEEMKVRRQEDLEKYSNDLIDTIKKKSSVKKEAIGPLAIAGIAAAVILPIVACWWYSAHSTSNATINTGIDYNITNLDEHVDNYIQSFIQLDTSEQSSDIVDDLTRLKTTIGKVKKTRDTFISNSKALADQLRGVTSIDTTPPTAKIVLNNLSKNIAPEAAVTLKPSTQKIVDTINKYNKRYAIYVQSTIIPTLQEDLKYLKSYFTLTQNIEPAGKESGAWESTKQWISDLFSSNPNYKKEGEKVIIFLQQLIASLQADIQLREIDSKRMIDSLTKTIEADISKEFGGQIQQKPQAEEDMSLDLTSGEKVIK